MSNSGSMKTRLDARQREARGSLAAGYGAAVALGVLAGVASAAAQQVTFPGGAQSVNEAFQDWRVACTIQGGAKRCAISQQQADSRTRQRILTVELQPKADKAEGLLFLPFGLALEKGVNLQVGEAPLASLRFSTCLPQGCVVPLSFDAKALAALKKGATMRVETANDAGRPQNFTISLKGFGPALDRAATLILK